MGLADYIQTQTQMGIMPYRSRVYGDGFQTGRRLDGISIGATDPLSTVDWVQPTVNGLQAVQNRFTAPITNVNLATFVKGQGGGNGVTGPQGPRGPAGPAGEDGAGLTQVQTTGSVVITEGSPTIVGNQIQWTNTAINLTASIVNGVLTINLVETNLPVSIDVATVCP